MLVAGPKQGMKATSSKISCFSLSSLLCPRQNPTLVFFPLLVLLPPSTLSLANHHLSQVFPRCLS